MATERSMNYLVTLVSLFISMLDSINQIPAILCKATAITGVRHEPYVESRLTEIDVIAYVMVVHIGAVVHSFEPLIIQSM